MNALICGVGEYVTGYTPSGQSKSDKSLGVVGLVHFDLRERKLIGEKIGLCGTNGDKFEQIREHFAKNIKFDNVKNLSFEQFPKKGVARDPQAYREAVEAFQPGDICSVFTPDDTHFEICKAALQRGLHVMCTKPMVKTLEEHLELVALAEAKNLLLQIEVHKRFDPMYNDARMRIHSGDLGRFNFFTSYMSQPKFQLETFRSWAGLSSDISYYLNSHHVDLHVWMMQGRARCVSVRALASTGVAEELLGRPCEDTITLMAEWENINVEDVAAASSATTPQESESAAAPSPKTFGHATYTASWTAAKSDVHSQQRFFCLMEKGEITTDQCHRGYTFAGEQTNGLQSLNPLYIRNVPDSRNCYCGQSGYGYVSFQKFVEAAKEINEGKRTAKDCDCDLPTGKTTLMVTAILEAGKRSLENDNCTVRLLYENGDMVSGLKVEKPVVSFSPKARGT
ncbi:unnamed protein product [Amoebophrya sp. A120]|nr:unnamed protein product [Amoebophrya sp. A120]|eukprot:GSA120T00022985001.1